MNDFPAATVAIADGEALRLRGFPTTGVTHAFSTRRAWRPDSGGREAWGDFLTLAGFPADARLVTVSQVHGAEARVVGEAESPNNGALRADGLATRLPGVILAIRTADCAPVLLADFDLGVVGAAHAGWRGALAGIVEKTLAAMRSLGAEPRRIRAAIGPTIGRCCFEVGPEVAAPFAALDPSLVTDGSGPPHVDLPRAVTTLLRQAGVPENSIHDAGVCTRCRGDLFFSYRGEGGRMGSLLAAIARSAPGA